MKIQTFTIIKLSIISIIFTYVSLIPISSYTNIIDALVVLILSLLLVYRSRNNLAFFLMFIFICYVNYSIVIGEYLIIGDLSVPFFEVKTQEIYGITIRVILLFMFIVNLFYDGKNNELETIKLKPKDNFIAFYVTIFMLLVSLVIGVDRGDYNYYEVRISPIFEYSKILFLFAYYFSGNSRTRKIIFTLLIGLFIFQDVYYGGRITSVQLIILFFITMLIRKLTIKNIITITIIGVFLNSFVAAYRINYSFANVNLIGLYNNLKESYFVFDTATFAYYASATHVAATDVANISQRINSFLEFFKSIFFLSDSIESDVTTFVATEFFYNMGGGLLPTHFYFWFGWLGVILISFIVVMLLNKLKFNGSDYQKILILSVVFTVPRWYLYSPNQLIKGAIFIITLIWFLFWIIRQITSKPQLTNAELTDNKNH
ncbi:hypothetical protein [Ureibacillus manganicus]|uniref:hypothetical protein n=1 Tax=Ureibacillus manganicus TaxID=1266064 RepID=UPI000689219E|nr:hypothetical protein [Ureibacillus manganicus]